MINDSNNFMFLINASVYGSLKVLKTTEKSHLTFESPFTNPGYPHSPNCHQHSYHTMCQRKQFSTTWTAQNQEHLISASTTTVSPNPVQLIILQKLSFLISLKCTKPNPAPILQGNKIWLAFMRKEMLTEKEENTVILGRTTSVSLRSEISYAKSGLQDLFQLAVRTLYQTASTGNKHYRWDDRDCTSENRGNSLPNPVVPHLPGPQPATTSMFQELTPSARPQRHHASTKHRPHSIWTAGYRRYWTLLLPISYG